MRLFVLLLLASLAANSADFYTGQAARAVVGQKTFTAQAVPYKEDPDNAGTYIVDYGTQDLLGSSQGVAYKNGILVVIDANMLSGLPNNNRVLIYRNWDAQLPSPTAEFDPQPDTESCPVCVGLPDVVLGQTDFETIGLPSERSASTLNRPTSASTDGTHLVIADTWDNRVLIWNSIPTANGQPADVVLGQVDFVKAVPGTSQSALRGPQGVWIDDQGRLWVADSGNYRLLMWNSIPTQNNANADLVLGQKDFSTGRPPVTDLSGSFQSTSADKLNTPVSVSSDGQHLFVSDLGSSRVLIWNSIPTQNGQSADVVIGQAEMTAILANNSSTLCESTGTDDNGDAIYPSRCGATLNFPRAAISDGQRLFIADGGNDRILVFNHIPTEDGAAADVILGQPDDKINLSNESTESLRVSSSDSFRTPTGLAWDGTNLYVADVYNRRVVVYTGSDFPLKPTAVRNAASVNVYAIGAITFSGSANEGDKISVTIGDGTETNDQVYTYTEQADDTLENVISGLVEAINAAGGDPLVVASANLQTLKLGLTAREAGEGGNSVTYSVSANPTSSPTTYATDDTTLSGGKDAARVAPYSLLSIFGDNLSDQTASADFSQNQLPWELGGVQVYFDGIRAPLFYVSPGQINTWMPVEVSDRTGVSAVVRTTRQDGTVTVTTASAVPIVSANPGLFGGSGSDPRPGLVLHASSYATGAISVDGSGTEDDTATVSIGGNYSTGTITFGGATRAGDVVSITIGDGTGENDEKYTYTEQATDTVADVISALVLAINADSGDPLTVASSNLHTLELTLTSKTLGVTGDAITYSVSVSPTGSPTTYATTGSTLTGGKAREYTYTVKGLVAAEGSVAISGASREGDVFKVNLAWTETDSDTDTETDMTSEYSYTVKAGDDLPEIARGMADVINASNSGDGDDAVEASASVPSLEWAGGTIKLGGTTQAGDVVEVRIGADRVYSYTVQANDSLLDILHGLVSAINSGEGDPQVHASAFEEEAILVLNAKAGGAAGNLIPFYASVTRTPLMITYTPSSGTLSGGSDDKQTYADAHVTFSGTPLVNNIFAVTVNGNEYSYEAKVGDSLTDVVVGLTDAVNLGEDENVIADADTTNNALYLTAKVVGDEGNSIQFSVSVEAGPSTTTLKRSGGYLSGGQDTGVSLVLTAKSPTADNDYGNSIEFSAAISSDDSPTHLTVSGTALANGREADSLLDIRDALVDLINHDPDVRAERTYYYSRIRLIARRPGEEGNGIAYRTSTSESANVLLTALTNELCCANIEDAPVTVDNPALPGEQLKVLAVGLGLPTQESAQTAMINGQRYEGPAFNDPEVFVSGTAGGKTIDILNAGLKPGTFGIYEVLFDVNSGLEEDSLTVMHIAQDVYASNTVTFPIVVP